MQLKVLAAIVSVAFTLGVQAAPNPFDRAAGVLKRSYYHGKDMSQVSKRSMALAYKKRNSNHQHRVDKQCKTKTKTTPTTPTPQQPETTPPTQQPETTPPTQQPETTPPTQQPESTPPTQQPESTPPTQQPETTPPTQQPETTPDAVAPISSPAPEPNRGKGVSPPANNNNTESGSTSLDAVTQEWLDQHNQARAQHGANPLIWSSELAAYAEKYANACVWPHSDGPYGENLAAGTGSFTPTNSVQMWMSEVGDYDPQNPIDSHFTQVVWKSTTKLGCAIVNCHPGGLWDRNTKTALFAAEFGDAIYAVCEYDPAGNASGQFGENVQK